MKRKHLAYKATDFPDTVINLTGVLFDSKPWRTSDDDDNEVDFYALAQSWATDVAVTYEVPAPTVANVVIGHPEYVPAMHTPDGLTAARILVRRSMTQLFISFGHHLAAYGKLRESLEEHEEATRWAYSLFYLVRPQMFRARVREGRIPLDPYAIYSSQTEQALRDYDVDPTDSHALSLLAQAQQEALSETGDGEVSGEPGDETAVSENEAEQDNRPSHDALRVMTTRALRVYATSCGVTGSWNMTKPQLLSALGVPEAAEVR